jgi:hypothetical protein
MHRGVSRLNKVALASVVTAIPIVQIAIIGYAMAYLKGIAEGSEDSLPSWRPFFVHWRSGFVALLTLLPVGLLAVVLAWAFDAVLISMAIPAAGRLPPPAEDTRFLWAISYWLATIALSVPVLPALARFAVSSDPRDAYRWRSALSLAASRPGFPKVWLSWVSLWTVVDSLAWVYLLLPGPFRGTAVGSALQYVGDSFVYGLALLLPLLTGAHLLGRWLSEPTAADA